MFLKNVLPNLNNYVILLYEIKNCLKQYSKQSIVTIAIQKLFEIRIFGCARGDFTTSGRPLVFYRNVRKSTFETETTCECVDLMIPGIIKQTDVRCKMLFNSIPYSKVL